MRGVGVTILKPMPVPVPYYVATAGLIVRRHETATRDARVFGLIGRSRPILDVLIKIGNTGGETQSDPVPNYFRLTFCQTTYRHLPTEMCDLFKGVAKSGNQYKVHVVTPDNNNISKKWL